MNEDKDVSTPSKQSQQQSQSKDLKEDEKKIIEWVNQIKDVQMRETALSEWSKKRESFVDLALYIWYSTGTVSALLQEIITTYQLLAPPKWTIQTSNRACNVLALFQCVAAHSETRPAFLAAQIPIFLYPFLNTVNKTRPFEYLRLTALGVIGALVKVDNPEVISFLLSTEIIPLCLRIMERGSEWSKTVATFIVQRILLDEKGLDYICNTAERFYAISSVLSNMINSNPSARLVKHIIRSYARLADNTLVRGWVKDNIPQVMNEKNFINKWDDSSKRWMLTLMKSLNENKQNATKQINTMQHPQPQQPPQQPSIQQNNLNTNMNMMPNFVLGQMPPQQGYMMQSNEYVQGYGIYNDQGYAMDMNTNKGIYQMPPPGNPYGGKNYCGMVMYPGYKK